MFSLDLNSYMTEMVYELVPNVRKHGDELIMKCPICGDSAKKRQLKRGHWYINEGMYYCFNGGCPAGDGNGMSGYKFLSIVANKSIGEIKTELLKRAGNFSNIIKMNSQITKTIENSDSLNSLFDDMQNKLKEKQQSRKKLLLNENWEENLPKFVENFLNKRKIFDAPFLPKDYQFYYNKSNNRLVIPWCGEYYQERALTKKDEESFGKYLFPANINKEIFGLSELNENFPYLFLLEGVFDSIFVKNGVAVGGLNLSQSQKTILNDYTKYSQIIFMDNQWVDKSSYEKSLNILRDTPFTKIFIWPKKLKQFKDVNDTIIYSNDFLRLWTNEKFLISRIFNGVKGLMELKKS